MLYCVVSKKELRLSGALFAGSYKGVPVAIVANGAEVEGAIVKPLTRNPEKFFRDLKEFSPPFSWRKNKGAIELAVLPEDRGWWVGTKGRRVQALEAHLRKPIRIENGQIAINSAINGIGFKMKGVPVFEEGELLRRAMICRWRQDAVTHGYIAPWEMVS